MSMKRLFITCVAVSLIGAGTALATSAGVPRVRLRHFVCRRALDPAERAVSVTAVMRPVKGTEKLALRFELLSRATGGRSAAAVNGGDLNSWISPANPTLGQRSRDVWILNKQVVDLMAPAAYRFRVMFRWSGAHNRVLATAERDTPTCAQPELRPDLSVQSISVSPNPTQPMLSLYVATIRNLGLSAAGPFTVLYSPGGGGAVKTHSLNGLASGASTQVTFLGPSCSSRVTPTITVDPNERVDDPNRANNSKAVVCPAGATPALKRASAGR